MNLENLELIICQNLIISLKILVLDFLLQFLNYFLTLLMIKHPNFEYFYFCSYPIFFIFFMKFNLSACFLMTAICHQSFLRLILIKNSDFENPNLTIVKITWLIILIDYQKLKISFLWERGNHSECYLSYV